MSGVWTNPRWAALGAGLLAVLGAFGLGPAWSARTGDSVILSDASASCASAETGRSFEHSDLLRAVREAVSQGARRVVLYTDGCDTTGAKPTNPGVPVDVVLRPRRDNVGLLAIHIPARIPPGAAFLVRVEVGRTAAPSGSPTRVRVRLSRDGESIGSAQAVTLKRGSTRSITFVDRVPRAGVVRYRAKIEGGAGGPADDQLEAIARIGDRPQVLVFGSLPAWADNFEITGWRSGMALDGFDAILLAEPPPTRAVAERIERAVRSGTGLLVLGHAPRIESLLPLTDDPPEGRAAVVLVDVSGSMERHLDAIRVGFSDLAARLAPRDRVALILFRDQVVHASAWAAATDAETLWKTVPARGNTLLGPAARRAMDLLGNAKARHRRLYVVSDGEWGDEDKGALARLLAAGANVHRAALFVADDAPDASRALFPVHAVASAEPLDAMLVRLEEQAPDRWVRDEVRARVADVPAWFRGAVSGDGVFRDFVRLYPKGEGERVALAADTVPVVAVRTEGGRIVQAACADAVGAAALRACIRDDSAVELTARREGNSVLLSARGSGGVAFRVGERTIPARAVASDRWEARLAPAPPQSFSVECAGTLRVVPAVASAELSGLHSNIEFAAALARVSGGRFARDETPAEWTEAGTTRAAAFVTLLVAALLVVVAAILRRGR